MERELKDGDILQKGDKIYYESPLPGGNTGRVLQSAGKTFSEAMEKWSKAAGRYKISKITRVEPDGGKTHLVTSGPVQAITDWAIKKPDAPVSGGSFDGSRRMTAGVRDTVEYWTQEPGGGYWIARVEAGYRILDDDEIVQSGDMILYENNALHSVLNSIGKTVGERKKHHAESGLQAVGYIRRKEEKSMDEELKDGEIIRSGDKLHNEDGYSLPAIGMGIIGNTVSSVKVLTLNGKPIVKVTRPTATGEALKELAASKIQMEQLKAELEWAWENGMFVADDMELIAAHRKTTNKLLGKE